MCLYTPEKWWWKQILASRWWKGMLTPSSLTELHFRSPDSSNFANASLKKQRKINSVFNYSSAKT